MLYNPHRDYDKGMDDAYMGYAPQNTKSNDYMAGYGYAEWLLTNEQEDERSVATKMPNEQNDGNQQPHPLK